MDREPQNRISCRVATHAVLVALCSLIAVASASPGLAGEADHGSSPGRRVSPIASPALSRPSPLPEPLADQQSSPQSSAQPSPQSSPQSGPQSNPQSSRYIWPNGPSPDPDYFPISVWLQTASRAEEYKAIGINLYVGQWKGPTDEQLDGLTAAGMPVMATQNDVGLRRSDEAVLMGWTQQDEPDNAQPDGAGGYGPCVEPAVVQARYDQMRAADPTRPVFLNLGQGVAHDYDRPYVGRGSHCSRRWEQYPEYVKAADIVSFDIYPVTSPYDHIQGRLELVARGVDRLVEWSNGEKIVWNVIETTHISSELMPTPHDVRAEVWMSLVHGSTGIMYFAHEWHPQFREAGLLHYPEMRDAVAAINAEITSLAPVLNSPTDPRGMTVETEPNSVPVDTMVKIHDDWTYVFAVAMRDEQVEASFDLVSGGVGGYVEVIGEDRLIPVRQAGFQDTFEGYGVHLYRFRSGVRAYLPLLERARLGP